MEHEGIDLVYLWCDLADPAFRRKRAEAMQRIGLVVNEGDNGACRYQSHDELRYSLRSAAKFAPWLRLIHIVIDDDISLPTWLNEAHPRLRIHRWGEIMPPEKLPCFNSPTFEFFLQDIPGLSERFLYANDDMLFSRPVAPSFFFERDGWPIFRYMTSRVDMDAPEIKDGYQHRIRESFRFAQRNFGIRNGYARAFGRLSHHNIDAYVKSDLAAFRAAYPEAWGAHTSHTFRSRDQLQREVLAGFAFSLGHAHYRCIRRPWWETMWGLPHRDSWHCIPTKDNIEKEFRRLKPSLMCMNDSPLVTPEGRAAATRFLDRHFPEPSSFEKDIKAVPSNAMSARSLVFASRRFDYGVKMALAQAWLDGDAAAARESSEAYLETIRAAGDFHEIVPRKTLPDDFLSAFRDTLDSLRTNGFDPRRPIRVDPYGEAVNGAHRIAAAAVLGLDVSVTDSLGARGGKMNWRRFRKKGLHPAVERYDLRADVKMNPYLCVAASGNVPDGAEGREPWYKAKDGAVWRLKHPRTDEASALAALDEIFPAMPFPDWRLRWRRNLPLDIIWRLDAARHMLLAGFTRARRRAKHIRHAGELLRRRQGMAKLADFVERDLAPAEFANLVPPESPEYRVNAKIKRLEDRKYVLAGPLAIPFKYRVEFGMKFNGRPALDRIAASEAMRGFAPQFAPRMPGLVVSLTSFGERLPMLPFTLFSLVRQTVRPQRIVLWLSQTEFPRGKDDLPSEMRQFEPLGVEFRFCRDLRSYTKIIPSLKAFPDATLVTCDDDMFYHCEWLEELVKAHLQRPDMIFAHRIHRVSFGPDSRPLPYNDWPQSICDRRGSLYNLQTGVGGVLYPARCLGDEVLDEDAFMRICPRQDDVWLWAVASHRGVKVASVASPMRIVATDPEKEMGIGTARTLAGANCGAEAANDKAVAAAIDFFGIRSCHCPCNN